MTNTTVQDELRQIRFFCIPKTFSDTLKQLQDFFKSRFDTKDEKSRKQRESNRN